MNSAQSSAVMVMHLSLRSLSWLVCLLSALLPVTTAQGPPNVTLAFYHNTIGGRPRDNQSSALTFSAGFFDEPACGFCLNLGEVFTSNSTSIRKTAMLGFQTPVENYINSSFATSGRENWYPSANYSTVLYKQLDAHDSHQSDDSDHYAQRDVSFHSGPHCNDDFTSNCRTARDCEEVPIAIGSFGIHRPDHDKYPREGGQRDGHCKLAAEHNAGTSCRSALSGVALFAMAVSLLQMFTWKSEMALAPTEFC